MTDGFLPSLDNDRIPRFLLIERGVLGRESFQLKAWKIKNDM